MSCLENDVVNLLSRKVLSRLNISYTELCKPNAALLVWEHLCLRTQHLFWMGIVSQDWCRCHGENIHAFGHSEGTGTTTHSGSTWIYPSANSEPQAHTGAQGDLRDPWRSSHLNDTQTCLIKSGLTCRVQNLCPLYPSLTLDSFSELCWLGTMVDIFSHRI